ncbi:hypothetical protein NA57DRAFT_56922 [Rhizodiscina lignyota]|uniref:MYND-type domain-containing protein n=1 Tax=Rhizodiscina lignyota TaxID=1504668 RepID=A0A9P4M7W8_9PEZI|nr:hypothetical protein NA57DRAFT_56922 [Rhizodiscina lignyota]
MAVEYRDGLISGCHICQNISLLQLCSRCRAVQYCSNEHQIRDFQSHKTRCKAIKCSLDELNSAQQRIRSYPGDDYWSGRVAGPRLDCMRKRLALVDALGLIKTRDSVHTQLHHLQGNIRLGSTSEGERVPFLLLRLDEDQDAYDFIKWWTARTAQPDERYLDVQDADAFEAPDFLLKEESFSPSALSATLLIKIKMLQDLEALEASIALIGPKVPQEILDNIQVNVLRSPIIRSRILLSRTSSNGGETMRNAVEELQSQIHRISVFISDIDWIPADAREWAKRIWTLMPDTYDAWIEVPGSIETFKRLMGKDAEGRL